MVHSRISLQFAKKNCIVWQRSLSSVFLLLIQDPKGWFFMLPYSFNNVNFVLDGSFCFCPTSSNNSFWCLRTINAKENFIYCEFVTSFCEFYDLNKDPYQVINNISQRRERWENEIFKQSVSQNFDEKFTRLLAEGYAHLLSIVSTRYICNATGL